MRSDYFVNYILFLFQEYYLHCVGLLMSPRSLSSPGPTGSSGCAGGLSIHESPRLSTLAYWKLTRCVTHRSSSKEPPGASGWGMQECIW